MSDGNGQATDVQKISSSHIHGCVGHSLSTDGKASMIVLDVGDGKQYALTIPTEQLSWLQSVITEMIRAAEKFGQSTGTAILHHPTGFEIGNSDQLRGHVVLAFDPGQPNKTMYVIENLSALKIAEGLRADIMPRLSMEQRRQAMMIQQKKTVLHNQPKLILPGN